MSYSISVYAISFDQLALVRGSRDRALVDAAVEEFDWVFSQFDDDIRELEEDNPEEVVPTFRDALNQFVDGDDLGEVPKYHGFIYGYAFEAICARVGKRIGEFSSIAMIERWMDGVDRLLAEAGIPLTLSGLVYSGPPIAIPDPDDFPMIGRWSPEQLAEALGPLRALPIEEPKTDLERDVLEIRRWVESASARPGQGMVGFLA